MNPAKLEWHDFPANGANYGEYKDGLYYLKLRNGDEVAVRANNQELGLDEFGNFKRTEWVTFEDWQAKEVDHHLIKQIALIRED